MQVQNLIIIKISAQLQLACLFFLNALNNATCRFQLIMVESMNTLYFVKWQKQQPKQSLGTCSNITKIR